MKMLQKVYSNISIHLSDTLFEAGGIIGGHDDAITEFYFDDKGNCGYSFYIPDICLLNEKIAEWNLQNLSFMGIVHSHSKNPKLSKEDAEYCKKVLIENRDLAYLISAIFVRKEEDLLLYKTKVYGDQVIIQSIDYMVVE